MAAGRLNAEEYNFKEVQIWQDIQDRFAGYAEEKV